MLKVSCCALVAALVVASGFGFPATACGAIQLAEWTFETSQPATAGPHLAEGGWFAGSSRAHGSHADPSVAYSSPAGNGSFHSFNSNRWSEGEGYEFTTSSEGFQSLWFEWHQTRSATGPARFQLQIDRGTGFEDLGAPYLVPVISWTSGSLAQASVFGPLALPPVAANLPELTLRLTALEGGSSWAGTQRVDNVVLWGSPLANEPVPEPGTLPLLALGSLLLGLARRNASPRKPG